MPKDQNPVDPDFDLESIILKDETRLAEDLTNAPTDEQIDALLAAGEYIKGQTAPRPRSAKCSYCDEPAIADSVVQGTLPIAWGYMCREHYLQKGCRPGEGSAQVLIDGLVKPPGLG